MINFNFGEISNVVVSTALGHYGLGMFPYLFDSDYIRLIRLMKESRTTVLTKSGTRFRRKGNFRLLFPWTWKYIKKIPNFGILNAYGLTNFGVLINVRGLSLSGRFGIDFIPNIYPEFSRGTKTAINQVIEVIGMYKKVLQKHLWAVELNFSCPNSTEAITRNTLSGKECIKAVEKKFPYLIVIVKASIVHPVETIQEWERAGASAYHCINTIDFSLLFSATSPLSRVGGGGVSGGPTTEMAFKHNQEIRKHVQRPMIFGCGVMDETQVKRCLDAGADAVSICSLVSYDPSKAMKVIKKYNL